LLDTVCYKLGDYYYYYYYYCSTIVIMDTVSDSDVVERVSQTHL